MVNELGSLSQSPHAHLLVRIPSARPSPSPTTALTLTLTLIDAQAHRRTQTHTTTNTIMKDTSWLGACQSVDARYVQEMSFEVAHRPIRVAQSITTANAPAQLLLVVHRVARVEVENRRRIANSVALFFRPSRGCGGCGHQCLAHQGVHAGVEIARWWVVVWGGDKSRWWLRTNSL